MHIELSCAEIAEPIEMPLLGPKSLRFFYYFLDFWFRALEREKNYLPST